MSVVQDFFGTLRNAAQLGPKATRLALSWAGLTAPRSVAFPDKSGTLLVGLPSVMVLADTAFTNTATTVATLTIPANTLTAGTVFEFQIAGSAINTTAASNLVINLLLNGAAVATATIALGTTAFATPGRGFRALGNITFRAVGAAGSAMPGMQAAVGALANNISNVAAAASVNTTNAVTLALRVGTSAATSTGTIRQAFISQLI